MEKLRLNKFLKSLPLLICFVAFSKITLAQNITLRGKIVDKNGEPLIGATVRVKDNPAVVTATNKSGDFVLPVPAKTTAVTITYIGYVTTDIAVKAGSPNLGQIPLAEDATSLNEVVVVGYGTQTKRDITGAITEVSEKSLAEQPNLNVANQLEGKVAGLDVISGGSALNATPSIRIRGSRTIGQSLQSGADAPLIVVDGVPYNGSLNDINPQDIKNLEVLKDASATAIYGSRGSGGVILITTNRGRVGQTIVTLDAYYGLDHLINQFHVLDASQYTQLKQDAIVGAILQGGQSSYITPVYPITAQEQTGINNGTNTNWQSALYQNAMIADQTVGVSGGTDKTQFNVSAGYRAQTAVEPNVRNERYNMQMVLDAQVSKNIKVGGNMTNTLTYYNNPGNNQIGALIVSPLVSPFNANGSLNVTPWLGTTDAAVYGSPLETKYNGAAFYNNTRSFHNFTNLYAEVEIVKGLKYRFTLGYDYQQSQNANYTGINGVSILTQSQTTAGITDNYSNKYTLDNLLTYDRTFANKHHVTFTALFSNERYHQDGVNVNVMNVPADVNQAYYLSNSTETGIGNGNGFSENSLISEMARVAYSYDGRLALTATVRNDASSELATGHQYLAYPAVGAAWNISNEKFMQKYNWVNNLKLRAGYGVTSNGPMGGAAYQTLGKTTGESYEYGGVTSGNQNGLIINTLANPLLTWQKTGEWNVGFDFAVLKNRLTGTVDVYTEKTTGILLGNALPATIGATNQTANLGTSADKGLEIALSSINIQNLGGFSWSTDFNIAFSRERIVSLPNGIPANIGAGEFVGSPLSVIYDYKRIGIWQLSDATQTPALNGSGQPIINPQTGTPYMISGKVTAQTSPAQYPGQVRVQDVNGDGKIDVNDDQIIGSYQPQYTAGLTNRFSYKGFDLSIVINARMGQTALVPFLGSGGSAGGWAFLGTGRHNQPYENYWTPSNPGGQFPEPNSQQQSTQFESTLQYFDGSWIKCRSINLGYNIPSKLLAHIGVSSLRVYANVTNPFIIYAPIDKYTDGMDPEAISVSGGNAPAIGSGSLGFTGSNPRPQGVQIQENTRNFILGMNLRF